MKGFERDDIGLAVATFTVICDGSFLKAFLETQFSRMRNFNYKFAFAIKDIAYEISIAIQ